MHPSRGLLTRVIPVGVALLVAACATGPADLSSTPTPSSRPAASSSASSSAAPSAAQSAPPPSAMPSAEPFAVQVIGKGTYPSLAVVALAGWSDVKGSFVTKDATGGPVIGLSVWDVGQVPLDPCHWKTTLHAPGKGVDGLIQALVSQEGRNATTPTKVTLAGQAGEYLERSVPDWVVTGDADFAGCDDPGNGHHDFVSWFATDADGERYEQVTGQVDRLWVLDVNGQRLVVDATYSPDTTGADRAELASVVASLRLVAP
jgi:hypothetical protein